MAVRLLGTVKQPQVQASIKGRFFDRMQAKLVVIDLKAVADALEPSNDVGDDFQ
jgi:hypothetical protein